MFNLLQDHTDISNRVSESILGNPQNRAESSSRAETARTMSDWTLLLLLARNFSASGRCKSKLALGSDSGSPGRAQGGHMPWGSKDGSLCGKNTRDTTPSTRSRSHGWLWKNSNPKGEALMDKRCCRCQGPGAKSDNSFPCSQHITGYRPSQFFVFVFPSFLKLRFSIFLSKSAKQAVFLLAWDLILRLGEEVVCLPMGKPKESLASCLTTRLDFRLQTVKTSFQKRLTQEERNP